MTSNQEGRQTAIRASTGTTGQAVEDWHALFDDAGIATGSFNERMLAWINAELGTSYTNLNGAMWAYADNAGYDRWNAMATLVLAVSGAEELAGDEANALALDFTDDYYQSSTGFYGSAYILHAATPANDYNSSPDTEAASLFTYTGSSPKLTMGPSGTLRYQAHNLILQSEDFSNASWGKEDILSVSSNATTDPNGTTTADLVIPNTTSGDHRVTQTAAVGAGVFVISVCVKAAGYSKLVISQQNTTSNANLFTLSGSGTVEDISGVATGNGTITSLGDGWYRCSIRSDVSVTGPSARLFIMPDAYTAASGTANSYNWSGDGVSGMYFWGAHVSRYPADSTYLKTTSAARYGLPYEWNTSGVLQGIRVEPETTNLLLYNTAFDNAAWTETNIGTISAGSVVAPNGVAEAETLTASAGTAAHIVQNTAALTIDTGNYAWSTYVKAGTHNYVIMNHQIGSEQFISAVFDLSGGGSTATETDVGTTTGTIVSTFQESVGNGWYRIGIVGSLTTSVACTFTVGFAGAATGNTFSAFGSISWNAAGTETFSIWGAQLQTGSVATSPILTYGSTETILIDNISLATSAFPHSASAFTMYGTGQMKSIVSGTYNVLMQVDDGTADEVASIRGYDSGIAAQMYAKDGGNTVVNVQLGTIAANTIYKNALAVSLNDSNGALDGTSGDQADTSCTVPTVTMLRIGRSVSSDSYHGIIKQLLYIPRRVSDADLQTLTSTGALP